jgi:Ca2+-binding RTX toxin-like protein
MSSSNKGYKFTIENGSVTAIYEVKNGRMKREGIDSDETWSYDGTNVIKTEYEHGRSEVTTYTDIDGDGLFIKGSKSYASGGLTNGSDGVSYPSHDSASAGVISQGNGYQFTVLGDAIAQVFEVKNGISRVERIDSDETWAISGSNFVKTEYEHGLLEQSVFADSNGDGVYNRISKTYSNIDGSQVTQLIHSEHGEDGDDHWNGTDTDDYYYGSAGNDILNGGFGNDDLIGGDGDDVMAGGQGDDSVCSGDGNDTLNGGDGDDYLYAASGNDTVDAGAGDDLIIGGDGAGNDKYIGGAGIDTVKYTSATSDITIDLGKGTASSSAGKDAAKIGNDNLSGIENVIAGDFNDVIKGNAQSNVLTGGLGSDVMYGGSDKVRDVFDFNDILDSKTGASRDKIYNFINKVDDIDLTGIDANSNVAGDQSFVFNGQTAGANALWYKVSEVDGIKSTKDIVLYADTNGDAKSDFEIGLVGVTKIDAMDLLL